MSEQDFICMQSGNLIFKTEKPDIWRKKQAIISSKNTYKHFYYYVLLGFFFFFFCKLDSFESHPLAFMCPYLLSIHCLARAVLPAQDIKIYKVS